MSSKKKKPISSSTKSKKPMQTTLSDGTDLGKLPHGVRENIKKGRSSKHALPKKPFSTETGKGYEDYEIEDNFDSLEYPPPSKNPEFRKFWAETLDNMVNRENFKPAHLGLLEVYCRLRVELRRLDDFVLQNGHTYRVVTYTGEVRKTYPEVLERHKILGTLHKYAQLLDLKPAKDKSKSVRTPVEDDEWD